MTSRELAQAAAAAIVAKNADLAPLEPVLVDAIEEVLVRFGVVAAAGPAAVGILARVAVAWRVLRGVRGASA